MDRITFLISLRCHLSSLQYIEESSYNQGNVIFYLFDEDVKVIESFNEEDCQGSCYIIYEFENMYFYLKESYGSCSGCDEWIDNTSEAHELTIERILNNITAVHNLWELPIYDGDLYGYAHFSWRTKVTDLMMKHGCLEKFNEHQERLQKIYKEEREQLQKEYEKKKAIEAEEKRKKDEDQKADRKGDIEKSIVDLVEYFNHKDTDPFFREKSSAKYRHLKYFVNAITEDYTDFYQQKKKEAEEILAMSTK